DVCSSDLGSRQGQGEIMTISNERNDSPQSAADKQARQPDSFAEVALKLGGKSEEEARRTGAIDSADDHVERLYRPQGQTSHSPVFRAVWDRGVPIEEFQVSAEETPDDVRQIMERS